MGALPFHIERIAWAKANEKITSHLWWPLCLPPNAKKMADDIYKEIIEEMKEEDKFDYVAAGIKIKEEKKATTEKDTELLGVNDSLP